MFNINPDDFQSMYVYVFEDILLSHARSNVSFKIYPIDSCFRITVLSTQWHTFPSWVLNDLYMTQRLDTPVPKIINGKLPFI